VQAGRFPAAGVAELLHFTFKFNFFTFPLMKTKYAKNIIILLFFKQKRAVFSTNTYLNPHL